MKKLVDIKEVEKILVEEGVLRTIGLQSIPHVTPTHGWCCTCQVCGYSIDGCRDEMVCVCNHNSIVKKLLGLRNESSNT